MFRDDFGDWAVDTVIVLRRTGGGMNGTSYGPGVEVEGVFVEHKRRLVRGSDGRERVSETTVYGDTAPVPEVGDRVRLPDGQVVEVVVSAQHRLEGAFDHWTVNCG
jgi:hypothetical protein